VLRLKPALLKAEADGELHDPRIAGALDFAESRSAGYARAWGVEVGIVQQVEEIAAELRLETLGDAERLAIDQSSGGVLAGSAHRGARPGQRKSEQTITLIVSISD